MIRKEKVFLSFLISFFFPLLLLSQTAPPIQWQNTIGGTKGEELAKIFVNNIGNYIIGGSSMSDSSYDKGQNSFGESDFWLIELNQSGQILWQCNYGGDKLDAMTSLVQTTDFGYLIGGYSGSGVSGNKTDSLRGASDFWLLRVDSIGSIMWQKTIGGSNLEMLNDLIQTHDGGFLIGGNSSSEPSGEKTDSCRGSDDYWILKLSDNGSIQWQKTIGGYNMDILRFIKQTNDEGFLLGGESLSDSSADRTEYTRGFFDYWFVKLDSIGNIIWQKAYGGNDYDAPVALELTSDNGFVTAGFSFSNLSGDKTENSRGVNDYWIIKADSIGVIQWQKTIGGNADDAALSISATTDSGYLIGGISNSDSSGEKMENNRGSFTPDFWIVKLDSIGNIQWQKTIGGNDYDELYSVLQTSDGGYILGGFSISPISGEKTEGNYGGFDYWIIKLGGTVGIEQPTYVNEKLFVYPNPAIHSLSVSSLDKNMMINKIVIINIFGQRIKSYRDINTNSYLVNLFGLPSGIYAIEIETNYGMVIKKFIKE